MHQELKEKIKSEERIWDSSAVAYEERIVKGHPDILNFESFEEEFTERLLVHLARAQSRPVRLIDVGCGSGRLHILFGKKISRLRDSGEEDHPLCRISSIYGIDFSSTMLDLARKKVAREGLDDLSDTVLTFEKKSAFELTEEPSEVLPVAVSLINSIGVMQGPEGARKLIHSMKNSVRQSGGVALISAYRKDFIPDFALNQYESTMSVSGQPLWLKPDRFASRDFIQQPRNFKRAGYEDITTVVDVYASSGKLVQDGHILYRDPDLVRKACSTGRIRTYWDYASNWYGYNQMNEWGKKIWGSDMLHFTTGELDPVRAVPGQFMIFDPSGLLKDFSL